MVNINKCFDTQTERQADVTVLVNSCDLYEDAWTPFFRLISIQWPDIPYDIVLNTEQKEYKCDFLSIKTICGGNIPWAKRLKKCLNEIQSEYILFFLEDSFLREKVNIEYWNKSIEFMRNNPDVGCIFLRQTGKQSIFYDTPFFDRDTLIAYTKQFRLVGLCALYRKSFLFKIIREHETPWEFEQYASIRSKRYPYRILQYGRNYPPIFVHDDDIQKGFGISKRKWLPNNKQLFESYGISVDFEKLGWYSYNQESENSCNNVHIKKSGFREFLYIIKKRIVRFPKLLNKQYRKMKSLI